MDQEEFLRLFLKSQAEIRAFLESIVRDRHASDDLFQDVAMVLWREFGRYDASRSFGAWARGIAAKKAMQHWEKSRRQMPFSPEALDAVMAAYDRSDTSTLPRMDALQQCLELLPAKHRKLLEFRYHDAMPLGKIAEALESTVAAVHKALTRLRGQLHDCVERRLGGHGTAAGATS